MNNDELISAGHELEKFLDSTTPLIAIAKLLSKMATQLNVTTAALREKTKQCEELAAENAGLKAAFDKPQAYLSWHAIPPTWEDPLPCGEYLDVHNEAGHKNSDGTDCWPVYAKPEIETPATDAFMREVRAQAITSALDSLDGVFDTDCVMETNGISYEKAEQRTTGALAVNSALIEFADQLRQGGAA
ncbi:hypothetical protein SMY85_002918 [Cronobacter sakazakii]|nr:hypothetical protein [Cronobacter sakazakii]ELY4259962.1 hypothetical protein [Cronobacter sakazakii]ELY4668863.1 hypothetical protein [Cronobacter sakazakii]